MKAAVFYTPGKPLSIETVSDPSPLQGEAVIRVRYCGVCGTDLHATENHDLANPLGSILGHEFTGDIVALGANAPEGWSERDRLCALPYIGCGRCLACRLGHFFQCSARQIIGSREIPGGFSEFVRVQLDASVRLPESVSWKQAALVEPLAVGLHAVRKVDVSAKNILVIGAGPIGLAAIFWCHFFGARRIIVSEFDPGRAQLALNFGATNLVDASADIADQFREIAGGPPELILECVGVPGMIAKCIDLAPHGGQIVVIGFCMKPDTFTPALAMRKELEMRFVVAHEKSDFQFVVDMIAAGRLSVDHMITTIVGFDGFSAAFEGLRRPSNQCKILLEPGG
jgi:(R,R)-butanediol dehydrogenase/meso-butanediol dehydrogenase/diacetyl reductase